MFSREWKTAGLVSGMLAIALLVSGCGPSAADDSASDELVFAAVPSEESTSLEQDYKPVLDMLTAETGKKIRFQKATDYAAIIEGQRAGKIDIAKYGPFSYVMAKKTGVAGTAVAGQVEQRGGKPGYTSYGVTRPDSGIRTMADFKGKKVCFVDPTSTSGYLYPKEGLLRAGVNPDKDIQPVYTGGHDASALAVARGDCDAGFAFDSMVDKQLIEKGQLKPGQLKTVWRSEVIPGDPVMLADDMDPALKSKISTALREKANTDYLKRNGFCTGECQVGDTGGWGFAPVNDAYYNGIRKVCHATKDEQCQ